MFCLPYILYQISNKSELFGNSCHVSLISISLIVDTYWLLPFGTLSLGMFYEEQHHTSTSPNPYVAYEWVKHTIHKQPNWPMGTMCVSVFVPWGPLSVCWVRGGQDFNKGTCLVQGCQSESLGTFNLMGSRWKPDFFIQTNSQLVHQKHFFKPLSGLTLGFEDSLSLMVLFISDRTMCQLELTYA